MRDNWFDHMGPGGVIGITAGSALGQRFSPARNPADDARKYLDRIPGQMHPYYDPYINAGRYALGKLQDQYGGLVDDPSQLLGRVGASYEKSPGYDFEMNQALQGATNAQAAGGMAGSPQHQQLAADIAESLASRDYNNYLSNYLGLYDTGLQGLGNLNQMGYGASTDLAQNLTNALLSQANLSYAGTINENEQNDWLGSLLGGIGGAAGF